MKIFIAHTPREDRGEQAFHVFFGFFLPEYTEVGFQEKEVVLQHLHPSFRLGPRLFCLIESKEQVDLCP
jgi:hypothetical protein